MIVTQLDQAVFDLPQQANYSLVYDQFNDSYTVGSSGVRFTSAGLECSSDIIMQKQSLSERLERIEKILNIPTRDIDTEAKYPRLRELYMEYVSELEKYKTWEKIKNE